MEENVGVDKVTNAEECVPRRSHSPTQIKKHMYVLAGDGTTVMFFHPNCFIMLAVQPKRKEAVDQAGPAAQPPDAQKNLASSALS